MFFFGMLNRSEEFFQDIYGWWWWYLATIISRFPTVQPLFGGCYLYIWLQLKMFQVPIHTPDDPYPWSIPFWIDTHHLKSFAYFLCSIRPDHCITIHCITIHTRFWAIAMYSHWDPHLWTWGIPWNSPPPPPPKWYLMHYPIMPMVFPWFCHDTHIFRSKIHQVLVTPRGEGVRAASWQRHDEHTAAAEIQRPEAMGWVTIKMGISWRLECHGNSNRGIYHLAVCYIAMENHHAIKNGKPR